LFIFLLSLLGKATVYSFVFPSFATSSIYIYIQIPHQTRQKSILKKITLLCGSVSSLLERTPVIGIIVQSVFFCFFFCFFWAFCTIYNRFSSSYWRLLDSSFPFSRHYALHSNRLYLICISNNNKTQERKSL
jgi:hypothetical protein